MTIVLQITAVKSFRFTLTLRPRSSVLLPYRKALKLLYLGFLDSLCWKNDFYYDIISKNS